MRWPKRDPSRLWGVVSLILSIMRWLSGLPLLFMDYDALFGGTAGVGVIGPFLLGLLSATFCLLGGYPRGSRLS